MSQSWTDNIYQSDHVYSTDLQNMENNFACFKSMFSGGSAPSSPVGGMVWFDSTQKVQKQRNAGDTAWIGLMHGDVNEKRPVYRDSAMDGYARDSGVTDKVIALKGGATYVAGAATAGAFQPVIDDHADHLHVWSAMADSGDRRMPNPVNGNGYTYDLNGDIIDFAVANAANYYTSLAQKVAAGGGSDWSHTIATYRPAAAVCILVYLDL